MQMLDDCLKSITLIKSEIQKDVRNYVVESVLKQYKGKVPKHRLIHKHINRLEQILGYYSHYFL